MNVDELVAIAVSRLFCVVIAPFGMPVVPPVDKSIADQKRPLGRPSPLE